MAAESQSRSDPGLPRVDPSHDHFARLGLARTWKIDRDALESNYLERSRLTHPDRFAAADSSTRRAAMEQSAALNEAYRVLRDPVARAEYLVKLGGIDLDSSDPHTGAPHPNQAFLIEMIERRDELDDASPEQLAALRERVEEELDEVFSSAIAALQPRAADEALQPGRADEANAGEIRRAAAALVHRRYLRRFLDELDAAAH